MMWNQERHLFLSLVGTDDAKFKERGVRHRTRRIYRAHCKMKAAKHNPVVLEVKPHSTTGGSAQAFGGARGDAEISECIMIPPPSKDGVRMKRKVVGRRDATTHPRRSAVFGCDDVDETPVKKPSKGVRMKRKVVDRRDATTHPRWSAVFGCDDVDENASQEAKRRGRMIGKLVQLVPNHFISTRAHG